MKVTDLIDKLIDSYNSDDDILAIIWQTDDVLSIAPALTHDQCVEVLDTADRCHDANHGVCWETLEVYADEILREQHGDKAA